MRVCLAESLLRGSSPESVRGGSRNSFEDEWDIFEREETALRVKRVRFEVNLPDAGPMLLPSLACQVHNLEPAPRPNEFRLDHAQRLLFVFDRVRDISLCENLISTCAWGRFTLTLPSPQLRNRRLPAAAAIPANPPFVPLVMNRPIVFRGDGGRVEENDDDNLEFLSDDTTFDADW